MENTLLHITPQGVQAFLASDAVRGIGKVYASRLVDRYGTDVAVTLRDHPVSITGIAGLTPDRISEASHSIRDIKHPLDILLFLYSCDVPATYIQRIFGKYRSRTLQVITTDPYRMVEEVWRLSFHIADRIGRALSIAPDDPRRLCGALLTAVKHYAEQGHLFATPNEAIAHAARITGADSHKVAEAVPILIAEGRLVDSRGGLYLPVYYRAERDGARRLLRLTAAKLPPLRQLFTRIPVCGFWISGYEDAPGSIPTVHPRCAALLFLPFSCPKTGGDQRFLGWMLSLYCTVASM